MIPISVRTTEEIVKVRVVNGNSITIAVPVTYEIKVTEPNFIVHTHTTDQIKMADDNTKTLTAKLEDMQKLIYAGL